MNWSFSKAKTFEKCQRKWFFQEMLANARSKDGIQREAYLLKQLQSMSAWRGALVDKVISEFIIPQLNKRMPVSQKAVEDYALQLGTDQLKFGVEKKHRLNGNNKSKAGSTYCALYDMEYSGSITKEAIQESQEEIKLALNNFLNSQLFQELSTNSSYAIPQRPLSIKFNGILVRSTPDLIVLSKNKPPLIVDWKVHKYGITQYWLQLGVYAYVLSRVKPHRDFPINYLQQITDPTQYRIVEFQLLLNETREYKLTIDDITDIEDFIFTTGQRMKAITQDKKLGELNIQIFRTANSPYTCQSCQFKKICWSEQNA